MHDKGAWRNERFQISKNSMLSKGHKVMFIPKFHCEINPTVCVWCHAKHCARVNCNYTFQGLENTIEKALNSVNVELIRKYSRKVREYHRAFRKNINRERKCKKLKIYKSHCHMMEITHI